MKLACFISALMLTATGCVSITTGPLVDGEGPGEPPMDDGGDVVAPEGVVPETCASPEVTRVGHWDTDDVRTYYSSLGHVPRAKLATDGARVFMVDTGTASGAPYDWSVSLRELTDGADRTAVVLGHGVHDKDDSPHVSIAMDDTRVTACWDDTISGKVRCAMRNLGTGKTSVEEWMGEDPVVSRETDGGFHVDYADGYGRLESSLPGHSPTRIPGTAGGPAEGHAVAALFALGETTDGVFIDDAIATNDGFMVVTTDAKAVPRTVSVWALGCDGTAE